MSGRGDKSSFDCAFVVKSKPAKCAKFDAAFCPKSCNMREECEAAMEARAGVLDETDDRCSEGTGKKSKGEGGVEGGSDVAEKAAAGSVGSESKSRLMRRPGSVATAA